ncbi:MAG: ATP-binding protein [Vicinamibacteria bacterium]
MTQWWSDITGRPVGAYALPDAWLDDVVPDDRAATQAAWERSLREGVAYRARYRIRAKDGSVRHMLARAAALGRPDGGHEMVGMVSDVTAEHKAAEATEVLRQLSRRLITAQDEERRRIARDLHDDLAQVLTAVKLSLSGLRPGLPAAAHAAAVDSALATIDHGIRQMRDLSMQIHPPMLDILGLAPALRWFLGQRLRDAPVEAGVSIELSDARFPPAVESACFRLVQEAVTNALRHSGARSLQVRVEEEHDALVVSVHDDGRGFDPAEAWSRAAAGGSAGLAGMQERVALAGGSFEVASRPGEGARIGARLPFGERA